MDTSKHEAEVERLRLETVTKARELFERKPEFPQVFTKIYDRDREIESGQTDEAKLRLSEPRLEYLLQFVDNRGQAYLQLVTDRESEDAFAAIMDEFMRWTWFQFSGIPIFAVPPISPFAEPLPVQSQIDRLRKRTNHWVMEGYRRLATASKPPTKDLTTSTKAARKILEPRPELLTNQDTTLSRIRAAEALGITPRTLDRWVSDQKLTPTGTALRKRFKTKDLKRLLDQKILDNRDTK